MTERVRGWKLQRLRRRLMQENPLCVKCDERGEVRAATELDHIVPLFKGGSNDEGNLQLLCEECHREKTAADLGNVYRPPIGVDGWPER